MFIDQFQRFVVSNFIFVNRCFVTAKVGCHINKLVVIGEEQGEQILFEICVNNGFKRLFFRLWMPIMLRK